MKFSFRYIFLLAAFSFGISGGFYAINGYSERYQIICLGFAASLAFIYSFFAEMDIKRHNNIYTGQTPSSNATHCSCPVEAKPTVIETTSVE